MKFKICSIAAAVIFSTNANAEAAAAVERITVQGKQYLSVSESNSVKTPTPIIDVPQSLSIITAEDISSRGFTSIGQIVDYMPGVNTSQGEGHRDSVVFRGNRSTADFYLDGNRDDVQYYRALYNIEQVEILRGPNALLFGRGGTGGILNRVSKKAELDQNFTGYSARLNTFGGYMTTLDANIATSTDSAVRVNAMYEELNNHRDFFDGTRVGFNPTARLQLSDDTILDVSYEYIEHDRFIDRGIPTANGQPVEALKDIVFADPQNNYHTLDAQVFRANLTHTFADNIKGNLSAFYGDFDKVYSNFYASNYDASINQVELDGYIDETVRDNFIVSGSLIGEFQTGGIEHTVMIGGEMIQTSSDQNRLNPEFSANNNDDRETFFASRPLNFRNGAGVNFNGEAFTVGFTDPNDDTRVALDVYSIYVQDEIQINDNLDLVIGARFDSFDIEVFNALPTVLETRTRKDTEISPRAGIIYKPQENISIYASYSESFLPRSGEQYANINGNNDALDPNVFENQELGIKWDINNAMSFTAALFQNEQSSPQVADNDPSTLDIIDQEIDGFELQLVGNITENLYITANYSHLDGEIVDRSGPTGRTPREIPEDTLSIWTSYEFNDVFGIGFGATYQSRSFINNSNSAFLPSYTRFDAAAYYEVSDKMRVQLNVENLTDKLYFPNAHSTHQATVGAPLNATLTLIGEF